MHPTSYASPLPASSFHLFPTPSNGVISLFLHRVNNYLSNFNKLLLRRESDLAKPWSRQVFTRAGYSEAVIDSLWLNFYSASDKILIINVTARNTTSCRLLTALYIHVQGLLFLYESLRSSNHSSYAYLP